MSYWDQHARTGSGWGRAPEWEPAHGAEEQQEAWMVGWRHGKGGSEEVREVG